MTSISCTSAIACGDSGIISIRLLAIIGSLEVGGAERHLVQVLPALKSLDYSLAVHTLTHKGKLARQLESAGIEVFEPPFSAFLRRIPRVVGRPALVVVAVISLWWRIVRLRPSLVHFFLPEAYLVGSLCSLAAGGNHCRVMSRRSLNRYQKKHVVLAALERLLHGRMTAILGNSRAVVAELVAEGAPQERVELIYNGVDLLQFEGLGSREAARRVLQVPSAALVMTVVANLIPYKGHDDLVEALSLVKSELPNEWLMLWVGRDSGIAGQLLLKAKSYGLEKHLRWLGQREDVPEILQASDIGLLCSHEEGFSNSLLEYMAASLPTIVTDVGGNAEAVPDGVCGRVVPAKSPRDLGRAIVELAGDVGLRATMGKAARERAEEQFSFAGCVSRYDQLYRRLESGGR